MTTKQDLKEMFDAGVHVGHRTRKWNPKMKKFIHGERGGVHIINLEHTVDLLDEALVFMKNLKAEGKVILFVSTKPQSVDLVIDLANATGMPFVVSKWIPGLLTNFKTVKTRIRHMVDLREEKATGEFDKYTKKEASKLEKTIVKLTIALGGVEHLKGKPDAVFVLDTVRDAIVVKEARKLGVPVVGVVDTNADPSVIDYPIPANDDAMKSLVYLLDRIKVSVSSSKAKK
ncbi:30S ribosomal protein S2 [Candidatus Gracilibacteria bacterium]|nr:30S ribosomal protein S2 [Candidatus Gracilibacteria bacterium]